MRYLTWHILLILSACRGYAQSFPNIQFTYLTEKEGLSNNQVGTITQDDEGFMWFGTDDGLNRFDGYRIRRFYHTPGKENALVNNSVYRLYPDRKNHLWICTAEGLSYYDKQTGMFHNFRKDPADPTSLEDDQFASVYQDHDNRSWIATSKSLDRFDSSYHFSRIATGFEKFKAERKEILSFGNIYEGRDHQLWASAFANIYRLDPKTMQVKQKFTGGYGNVTAIYNDTRGTYWIGTFLGGLRSFNPADGHFTDIPLESVTKVVNSIAEWKDQNNVDWIVLGTDKGMILLDPVTLKNKEYGFHPGYLQQRSISGNNVLKVFVDRQNILWIGTDGGVSYVEPSRQLFELWDIFTPTELITQPLLDYVYSCSEDSKGFWMSRWIQTDLFYFTKNGRLEKIISSLRRGDSIIELKEKWKPAFLLSQGDSVLWFTADNCLVHYNKLTGKASFYDTPDGFEGPGLRTIVPVDDRHWWIRTRNNGLNGIYIFDPIARKFTRHFIDSTGCSGCVPPYLTDIFLTSKKEIYLATRLGGLYKYDRPSDKFLPEIKFPENDAARHSNTFESIAEDRNGILWIGTFTGLFAFDPVSKKILCDYSSNERFGNVDVAKVLIDEQQNIWLNTQRGIFCIIASSGQIRQFSVAEGLPNNYTYGILQSASDHFIYSGISGYVVRIRPDNLPGFSHLAVAVHFSEAAIMDIPSVFHFTSEGKKQLVLEPGQNRFTLDFSVMNYDITANNHYFYLLDGVMTDWQQNENGHLAFYNLPPGTYTLHVKGGDKYGAMYNGEDAVSVIVQPNWWQTPWFKIACIALAIFLIIIFFRRRVMLIRKEASVKQKIAETEMMALRSQMNPHFIFNSLNSIENFMMKNEKRLASSYLNKFARLVRMILDSSRNEVVHITKDMEALQLYVDLEQLRYNNKFSFSLQLDPILRESDFRVPSLLIQPYVENAIMHGLAHSEKEGLELSVAAWLNGEYIDYIVEDNGIGRQQSALYNQQNKPHHRSIGLKITEDRINIFNQQQHANGHVSIVDLFDNNGVATGTRVEIKIKAL